MNKYANVCPNCERTYIQPDRCSCGGKSPGILTVRKAAKQAHCCDDLKKRMKFNGYALGHIVNCAVCGKPVMKD